jgi:RNA polymerase sigma-70 factor (ECF subfamily)
LRFQVNHKDDYNPCKLLLIGVWPESLRAKKLHMAQTKPPGWCVFNSWKSNAMPPRQSEITEVEQLYRQHGPALLLFATAVTGERSRAQDALHQVFLKLLEDRSLERAADVKAYLFACVRNAALNHVRVDKRNVAMADDGLPWFDPPTRDFAEEENLRRALVELPDDQRQVTVLHIWGELTFAQIADLLTISANTAASRYRYALARLRESMCAKEDSRADPR